MQYVKRFRLDFLNFVTRNFPNYSEYLNTMNVKKFGDLI